MGHSILIFNDKHVILKDTVIDILFSHVIKASKIAAELSPRTREFLDECVKSLYAGGVGTIWIPFDAYLDCDRARDEFVDLLLQVRRRVEEFGETTPSSWAKEVYPPDMIHGDSITHVWLTAADRIVMLLRDGLGDESRPEPWRELEKAVEEAAEEAARNAEQQGPEHAL